MVSHCGDALCTWGPGDLGTWGPPMECVQQGDRGDMATRVTGLPAGGQEARRGARRPGEEGKHPGARRGEWMRRPRQLATAAVFQGPVNSSTNTSIGISWPCLTLVLSGLHSTTLLPYLPLPLCV